MKDSDAGVIVDVDHSATVNELQTEHHDGTVQMVRGGPATFGTSLAPDLFDAAKPTRCAPPGELG